MRYHDIASGIKVPVYVEEQDLLARADKDDVACDQLGEREQELARLMVSRGLLRYFTKNGRVFFRTISSDDIWRERDG